MNLRELSGMDEQPMPGFRGATGISATPWYDQGILGSDYSPMDAVNGLPLAGSMAATALSAPTGPALVGAAGIGGAGGEALRQLIVRALAGPGRAPKDSKEAAAKIGAQAAWQAIAETLGLAAPSRFAR